MIEYSEEIGKLLSRHNFNIKNIDDILPLSSIVNIPTSSLKEKIKALGVLNRDGCIFTLSSLRRDAHIYVCFTILTSEEIIRRLNLKVFL